MTPSALASISPLLADLVHITACAFRWWGFAVWGFMLAETQEVFYESPREIRRQSRVLALYYVALALTAAAGTMLRSAGSAQVSFGNDTTA